MDLISLALGAKAGTAAGIAAAVESSNDSQSRALSSAAVSASKRAKMSSVVGHQWGARQTTGTAGTAYTYHQTFTVERAANRFRFCLLNTNTSPMVVTSVAMAVSTRLGTGSQRYTPSSGVWFPVTFNGGEMGCTVKAGAAGRPARKWSDWIDCSTIAPDDGTSLPVVMVRVALPTGPFSVGNYSFAPWAATSGFNAGRFLYSFRDAGDFASGSFSAMPGTTYSNPLVMAFEYQTDGPAFTFELDGDSITEGAVNGDAGNFGNGWGWQAITALRNANPDITIGYVNNGISTTTTSTFNPRQFDLFSGQPVVNAAIYSPFSPNDGTPTSSSIAAMGARLDLALASIAARGIPAIIWTPCVNDALAWNATADGYRLEFRTTILSKASSAVSVVDIEAAISDGATPARFQSTKTTDGTHPNETGCASIAGVFQPVMQALLDSASI